MNHDKPHVMHSKYSCVFPKSSQSLFCSFFFFFAFFNNKNKSVHVLCEQCFAFGILFFAFVYQQNACVIHLFCYLYTLLYINYAMSHILPHISIVVLLQNIIILLLVVWCSIHNGTEYIQDNKIKAEMHIIRAAQIN